MYKFDVENVEKKLIDWTVDWFERNGKNCNAVVGISGGKDSAVVASLMVKALGKERVFGVLMPNKQQSDIDFAKGICEFLQIKNITVNIGEAYDGIKNAVQGIEVSTQSLTNLAPRLRMSVLYYVAQSVNGRVANTCNMSEDYVGYSTRYGDSVGDFSPLAKLTVTEVKQLGKNLGLPEKYIEKPPIDGLSGRTDEDNLGFTYAVLDRYIREGKIDDLEIKAKIDRLNKLNAFKLEVMEYFPNN